MDSATVVPPGQRCSQDLRDLLIGRIGPGFRVDTRDHGQPDIAPQFECNQFTRTWRSEHSDGDRDALLSA